MNKNRENFKNIQMIYIFIICLLKMKELEPLFVKSLF